VDKVGTTVKARNGTSKRRPGTIPDAVTREVLLGFWKVHILHHAAEGPIYGQWIAEELRRHGYNISPGTLYPLLRRMERNGWIKRTGPVNAESHARREYRLTKAGREILDFLRSQVEELHREVVEDREQSQHRPPAAS
jgi:DNA-binding PadR family transcriptional regulator